MVRWAGKKGEQTMTKEASRDLLVLLYIALIARVNADPISLIANGDFEIQLVEFDGFSQLDVNHDGEMDHIPFYTVVKGGVQVLSAAEYQPAADYAGDFIIHLNSEEGPGVLMSTPLVTPRKGATYNVSFTIADNPDGGPLRKALTASILVNGRVSGPKFGPFTVSAPYSTRSSVEWTTVGFTFVGTGESTTLSFRSLVPGPIGPLIDNVNVTLLSLVENGSFEILTEDLPEPNITFYRILTSPSDLIAGWTVTKGNVKLSDTRRWQPSTDETETLLDLNAELTAGAIVSYPFGTLPGKRYKVLFDTTANPDNVPPIMGYMLASAFSYPAESLLGSRSVFVSGAGFTPLSMGWMTCAFEFRAQEKLSFVEFRSLMNGAVNGPLLDNILVYEIRKPARHKSVGATFSAGTALTPSWTPILAGTGALVIGICCHMSNWLSLPRFSRDIRKL